METLNENQDLCKQVSQLCNDKEELVKQNNMLQDKVCHQEQTLHKLEQIKKTMRMLNSSTTSLDQILEMVKRTKYHGGLGFKGENLGTNSLTST